MALLTVIMLTLLIATTTLLTTTRIRDQFKRAMTTRLSNTPTAETRMIGMKSKKAELTPNLSFITLTKYPKTSGQTRRSTAKLVKTMPASTMSTTVTTTTSMATKGTTTLMLALTP